MRPFARLWPRRSLIISLRRSCISCSCLASSSNSSSSQSSWILCREVLFQFGFLFVVILQGFFLFQSGEGKEILKVPCLPHSHSVGTRSALACLVVLQHQRLDSSGALGWLQSALSSPPTYSMSLDPRDLPSCSPVSVWALVLWDEVSKMLLKGFRSLQTSPVWASTAGCLSICQLSMASSR